ncbi:uncharacterized protein Nmag_2328 [Natrialba magadii ATCC 43099]|uniref:Uncharacterized protein n=1 Tax=Natrialba magadii (strain ATCC 43099 / DSM 3394 / CCM 3739 / CIP 104546 / IAM 13178 / JCM 8861 / NBRC 102185 / NCIMB 2190 / MS3) TaxID=547559 RepID=D3SXE1_NATMM|nr:hypothetical protein [Natrialba magadii]ADD05890.1 uncharacterized protein Nmag_2328 [Natrialba magadii ATCC 43099]ELY30602.1 hypothetical protein C500_08782 [Natrialba magadii ATCC 43099]
MDAVDDLGDAIDVTRELLVPVRVGRWLKLALVVLFVGGGLGAGGGVPVGDVEPLLDQPTPGVETDVGVDTVPDEVIAALGLLIVAGFLLWIAFAIVGAIMEFVFIESLRSNSVHIRRYTRANLGRGLRLFGFRAVALLLLGGVFGLAVLAVFDGIPDVSSLALAGVFAIPLYLAYALVMRFTSEFVAPVMLLEERGVLSGWRRFWPTVTSNWGNYAVYLALVWILQFVLNIVVGFVVAIGALAVAIPFVILGVLAYVMGGIGVYLAVVIGLVGVVSVIAVFALVQMPIRTYFQYYALLVLGDTNADLDLIPEQRRIAREGKNGVGGAGETVDASEGWNLTGQTDSQASETESGDGTNADMNRESSTTPEDRCSADDAGFWGDTASTSNWDVTDSSESDWTDRSGSKDGDESDESNESDESDTSRNDDETDDDRGW